MADVKISGLPASTVPLAGTEVLPIVQSTTTKQVSVNNLTAGRAFDALGLTLTSTDAGASQAPTIDLYRDSASPAASDAIGEIEFNGKDSAANKQAYALFHGSILSPTSGAEQGQLHFETATAGALTEKMIIGTTNLVINEPGNVFNVRIEGDTDPNLFYTDATNNRIGVSTTTPATRLDIRGTSGASSTVRIGSDSNDMGTVEFFSTTGTTVNSAISGNLEGSATGGDLRFATKATAGSLTEQMRITAAGNINVVTGNVVISTSGKGIDFAATPGTGTSELFADYEEGTWTPSLGGTASYNAAEGYYTKVGNLVTAACILYVNTIGTGSTTTITGLPFTARAAPARNSGSVGYFFSLSQNVVFLAPQIAGSGTSVNFQGLTAAGASTADPIAIFGNTAYIMFTITYFT
jgi:hypothetical protein